MLSVFLLTLQILAPIGELCVSLLFLETSCHNQNKKRHNVWIMAIAKISLEWKKEKEIISSFIFTTFSLKRRHLFVSFLGENYRLSAFASECDFLSPQGLNLEQVFSAINKLQPSQMIFRRQEKFGEARFGLLSGIYGWRRHRHDAGSSFTFLSNFVILHKTSRS